MVKNILLSAKGEFLYSVKSVVFERFDQIEKLEIKSC